MNLLPFFRFKVQIALLNDFILLVFICKKYISLFGLAHSLLFYNVAMKKL